MMLRGLFMVSDFQFKDRYNVYDLLEIMRILRAPGGCPWDAEQSHESIRQNFLEETYEAMEAIDSGDIELLKEELGDVLMQVVFHAQIEAEQDSFNFDDVADGVCQKLILRHPHVFGQITVADSSDVLRNWDAIKKVEKHQETYTDTLKSVPKVFPALMKAQKVQKRAARAGFDWDNVEGPLSKLEEETAELREAISNKSSEEINEEFGDLLFSAVNVARFIGADSEGALSDATEKFIARFEKVENVARSRGIDMQTATLEQLDAIWDEVKQG